VPEFDIADYISSKRPYLDPQTRCALAAAAVALESAAVVPDEVEPTRCGLAFSTMHGSLTTQAMFQDMVNGKGLRLGSPVIFGHAYPNTTASVMAIEFALRGYHGNLCGDILCGAQALEAAWLAIVGGRADMVLAGGADVLAPGLLRRIGAAVPPGGPAPAQGAAMLVVENREAAERRESLAFCELSSVVCRGTAGESSADGLARCLQSAVAQTMNEAEIWEGDIGIIFTCGPGAWHPVTAQAERIVLNDYAEVPVASAKQFIGETFGAGFAFECAVAADVLNTGTVPSDVSLAGFNKGVEFWVERRPEPLMGHAALVLGCTPQLAAAAVLRGL